MNRRSFLQRLATLAGGVPLIGRYAQKAVVHTSKRMGYIIEMSYPLIIDEGDGIYGYPLTAEETNHDSIILKHTQKE